MNGRWAMLGIAGCIGQEALGFGDWYDAPLWVRSAMHSRAAIEESYVPCATKYFHHLDLSAVQQPGSAVRQHNSKWDVLCPKGVVLLSC